MGFRFGRPRRFYRGVRTRLSKYKLFTSSFALRRNIHLEDEKSRRVEPDGQTSAEGDVAESAPAHVFSPDAGMSLAHMDIEQKGMGKKCALDEANALLAALFDRAPYGIVIAGIDGKFIRANTAFQVMTGLNEAELFNHSIESLTHQDDYLANKVLLDQLLSGERASFEIEKRYFLNDSTIWINSFVSTIDNSKCKNRYLVAIVRDITDRKRAEREVSSSQLELRSLYDRLQTIREEERIALAREVHDQLGQILSAAKIDIKLLEDDIRLPNAVLSKRKISTELHSARVSLEKAIESVRRIATELRPPELDAQGLGAAIEWHSLDFERRTKIKCRVEILTGIDEPEGVIATALFRIFQEATTNVLRHAKARNVRVSLGYRGNAALLRVYDDGIGIKLTRTESARSLGIRGMHERAAALKGKVVVAAVQPRGTLVSAKIPMGKKDDGFGEGQKLTLASYAGGKM